VLNKRGDPGPFSGWRSEAFWDASDVLFISNVDGAMTKLKGLLTPLPTLGAYFRGQGLPCRNVHGEL
jgi:hypothetical protein